MLQCLAWRLGYKFKTSKAYYDDYILFVLHSAYCKQLLLVILCNHFMPECLFASTINPGGKRDIRIRPTCAYLLSFLLKFI
jgi:hypothetical protein